MLGAQALQDLLDYCLKQNRNERPPNALEVYLRLQDLGKASGVLLPTPGALDKLLAVRGPASGNEPTLDQPDKPPTASAAVSPSAPTVQTIGSARPSVVVTIGAPRPCTPPHHAVVIVGGAPALICTTIGSPAPPFGQRAPGAWNATNKPSYAG